jgi:phosphoribosylformimino-5-aminoimidazole carboxamide ribotide isomerase
MELYPAIDIRDGGAVRLTQGDFDRQSRYGDPLDLARRFVADGAPWLHVVDLDAARLGRAVNRPSVLAIAQAVDIPVQSGGGVRAEADVVELLEGGVTRVVLGTVALDRPELVGELSAAYPGRVAVGVDYRRLPDGRTEVAVRGWEQGSGRTVAELLDELAGASLEGPDFDGLTDVLAASSLPLIASGGVGAVGDITALARLEVAPTPSGRPRRLAGAITGKALVDGRMTVAEGVAACAPSG